MDFDSHPDLYQSLLVNCNFEIIINLLIAKPTLDVIVYEKITTILDFNGYYNGSTLCYRKLREFTNNLILLNNFIIIEKIIKVICEHSFNYYLNIFKLFQEHKILDKYYDMAPIQIISNMKTFTHNISAFLSYFECISSYMEAIKFGIKQKDLFFLRCIIGYSHEYPLLEHASTEHKNLIVVAYSEIIKQDPEYFNPNIIYLIANIKLFDKLLRLLSPNYNFIKIFSALKTIKTCHNENLIYEYSKEQFFKFAVETNNNELLLQVGEMF
jgi:hypothetical protein